MSDTHPAIHRETAYWKVPQDHPSPSLPLDRISLLLHQAAGNQVTALGLGMRELHHQELTWMLSRFKVWLARFPASDTPLEVETWPWKTDTLRYYRDYRLEEPGEEPGEEPMALATSQWLMVDLNRRKPVRVHHLIDRLPPVPDKRALEASLGKMQLTFSRQEYRRIQIETGHLDLNRHVNNAHYLSWITSILEEQGWQNDGVPLSYEIHYLAEARLGDTIGVEVSEIQPHSPVEAVIVREADNQPITHFRIAPAS